MKHAAPLFALALCAASVPFDTHAASLADLSFLEGKWASDRSGFVIEESWTNEEGGVVIGMSRGTQNDAVRFLRFAVVEKAGDSVVMRFKRYNADYSSWEATGPSVMRLAKTEPGRVVFEATDAASDVQRITYRVRADGAIDVVADRTDEKGPYLVEFTLRRRD
ncbi:MAG: hypothetical protein C0520_16090 [Sphingopyxis sp.]|nr:hypothetical protein [Sphingopyxis sp.]